MNSIKKKLNNNQDDFNEYSLKCLNEKLCGKNIILNKKNSIKIKRENLN